MIDFHTHVLPSMDDGSDSIETSSEMLKKIEDDGVKIVCLTSHYYSDYENIDDYLTRRKEAFEKLNYNGNLSLILGAEVRFYFSMADDENLKKLCLDGTNILLIELPFFDVIDSNVINEIIKVKLKGYDVVLAHIERYKIKNETLEYLHNSGIKFQMNTNTITDFFTRRKALKMIENHYISYLGSDCHNLTTRPPFFKEALDRLKDKLKEEDLSKYIDRLYNLNV